MIDNTIPQLLKQIVENDDDKAFSVFFQHYHAKLLQIALVYVSSPQVAEDVVSDVLIKLLKNRKETFNKENFIGYLYQCVKNQSLDYLKKKKKQSHINYNYSDADYFINDKANPYSRLVHKEFEAVVADCIESMPPKRKLAFKMVKDDKLSYKEVGELLDISDRTVEVHLRLAVGQLRTSVNEYLDNNNNDSNSHLTIVNSFIFLASLLPPFEHLFNI